MGQDTGGGEIVEDLRLVGHSPVSAKEGNVRCRIKWRGNAENRRCFFQTGKRAEQF